MAIQRQSPTRIGYFKAKSGENQGLSEKQSKPTPLHVMRKTVILIKSFVRVPSCGICQKASQIETLFDA